MGFESHPRNVFDWLDQIRAQPGGWIRDESLHDLEMLVFGYLTAQRIHGLDEGVPSMHHFASWLELTRRWSMALGWARVIESKARRDQRPLDLFFSLVDRFRKLQPTTVSGWEVPGLRFEVVRYRPADLYFVRTHAPMGIEVDPWLRREAEMRRTLPAGVLPSRRSKVGSGGAQTGIRSGQRRAR